MKEIKEYEIGISDTKKVYQIDSNVLIALAQLYYRGECKRKELTSEIKKFIIRAREYGIDNSFSIVETCYDYNTNSINTEQLNKIMIAYDNLIVNMSLNEILNHKGSAMPNTTHNLTRKEVYKSIFECKLPEFLVGNNVEMKNAFYGVYLYFLKIYELNKIKESPMKKVKVLFEFMTDEIDVFLGYEFYLAVMLFIGLQKEKEISEGIIKPRTIYKLSEVLNAVVDIFQFRFVNFGVATSILMKEPFNIIFVTADESLQSYIEHNQAYNTITSEHMITPINFFDTGIRIEYKEEWEDFYANHYYPCIKQRVFNAHLNEQSDEDRKRTAGKIKREILKIEPIIYGSSD